MNTDDLTEREAKSFIRRLNAVASAHFVPDDHADAPRYACWPCRGTGFRILACPRGSEARDGEKPCIVCAAGHPHLVAFPCRSCRTGQFLEAGFWFKRVYPIGRAKKRVQNERAAGEFVEFLNRCGPVATALKECFEEIRAREIGDGYGGEA